jgi:hypothetical protein
MLHNYNATVISVKCNLSLSKFALVDSSQASEGSSGEESVAADVVHCREIYFECAGLFRAQEVSQMYAWTSHTLYVWWKQSAGQASR